MREMNRVSQSKEDEADERNERINQEYLFRIMFCDKRNHFERKRLGHIG
jgi:hypothetical protein